MCYILPWILVVLLCVGKSWNETEQGTSAEKYSPPSSSMDLIKQYRQAADKSCFILGATGEAGKALVKELVRLRPFHKVVLIGRRRVDYENTELKQLEQRVVDFDHLDKHKADFHGFDVGYCCLGATRSKHGAEGFVKVEHDYPIAAAKLAKQGGLQHFHLVSSMGVNENSFLLYGSTKGRTDREISEMGFERASIYRPGMLMVDREESRPLEAVTRFFMKPVQWIAPTLATTPVETLARAMIMNTVQEQPAGSEIVDNKRIHLLGNMLNNVDPHLMKDFKTEL